MKAIAPAQGTLLHGIVTCLRPGSARALLEFDTPYDSDHIWRPPEPPIGRKQCRNDKDGTVDADERLPITGVAPAQYDAKLVDDPRQDMHRARREGGCSEIFSIEERSSPPTR